MENFNEERFRSQVDAALVQVEKILETSRHPVYPENVHHKYSDKYLLAEFLSNTGLGAVLNCLQHLGLTPEGLKQLSEWAQTRSITLRLQASQDCVFDRVVEREVEDPTKHVTLFGSVNVWTDKVVRKVTEYFWQYSYHYEIFAFQGNNPDQKFTFQSRTGKYEIMTSTKDAPQLKTNAPGADANITFLFQNLKKFSLNFSIDRMAQTCRTPRRNQQISNALAFFAELARWARSVEFYFRNTIFPIQTNHGFDLAKINDSETFIPVLPLFEDHPEEPKAIEGGSDASQDVIKAEEKSCALQLTDCGKFLLEEQTSLQRKLDDMEKMFGSGKNLITDKEAKLMVLSLHLERLGQYFTDGVNYIESLLYKQLSSALGKHVTARDFEEYMLFHNKRIFKEGFRPEPFCYATRRPDHFPEGVVSIENSGNDPLFTITSKSFSHDKPMYFPISASTNVPFYGERSLHSWMNHQFEGHSVDNNIRLNARANQFSSFILMIGTLVTADTFEPSHAIIIQNQDDLIVPLILETIPTPKEFQDAIESLSPEQQRFCKAYRSMQLASTLFSVVILQIKPQLEVLLKLPEDSLTKEIRLSQDLLKLFIEHQIPSDLLSFGGDPSSPGEVKIEAVKGCVEAMHEMIRKAQEEEEKAAEEELRIKQIEEARKQAELLAEQQRLLAQQQSFFGGFSFGGNSSPNPYGAPGGYQPLGGYPPQQGGYPGSFGSAPSYGAAPTASYGAAPGGGGYSSGPVGMAFGAAAPGVAFNMPAQPQLQLLSTAAQPALPPPTVTVPTTTVPTTEAVVKPVQEQPQASQTFEIVKSHDKVDSSQRDMTKIPGILDIQFGLLDEDNCIRPTIIKPGNTWDLSFRHNLLTPVKKQSLVSDDLKEKKDKAFDLIDALSKSGALSWKEASLHVIIASSHGFDKSLIDTIVQDNVNPIEKVERSMLIVATTIHQMQAQELIEPSHLDIVKTYSPKLF